MHQKTRYLNNILKSVMRKTFIQTRHYREEQTDLPFHSPLAEFDISLTLKSIKDPSNHNI